MKILLASFLLALLATATAAQSAGDACHVYVVDVVEAKRAIENFRETGNKEADAKALSAGQTVFPEFQTSVAEEQLTTKHYTFPGTKLIITASVYYTDESLASHGIGEYQLNANSMVIGVLVTYKAQPSAIGDTSGDAAITEVTYDQYTNKVRAKKYMKVRGRNYLLGIECDCMTEKREK